MIPSYNIGISCIGGGVGQSVIDSLRLSRLPIKTFGLGINPLAYGAFDCDEMISTSSIYDHDYINSIIDIYKKHNLDLLIPGLDDEVLLFAKNKQKLVENGLNVIHSGLDITRLACNKELMSNELNPIVNAFVRNYSMEELRTNETISYPLIAKPKDGSASRGIHILLGRDDLDIISSEYVIQELAIPHKQDPSRDFYLKTIHQKINPQVSEISIQIVLDRNGHLMGRMMSYNKLSNGIPIEIIPFENDDIWSIVDQLTPVFAEKGLIGPMNIQGRWTDHGFKIFELNTRFTGITGMRALMGFNEVEACAKEWLGIDRGQNSLKLNHDRIGIRQVANKAITLNEKRLNPKKTLLITGTSGYLGYNLLRKIQEMEHFEFNLVVLNREKQVVDHINTVDIQSYTYRDLFEGRFSLGTIDVLLHLAFTRPHGTPHAVADSLKLTQELFTMASQHHVPAIINMSSQSVYGTKNNFPWQEDTATAPESVYGQAKYASELLLFMVAKTHPHIAHTSIRLGTVTGGAPKYIDDVLGKFINAILRNQNIDVQGGNQILQRFHVEDAVDGILLLLNSNPKRWSSIYNLGTNITYTLKEMATLTAQIGREYTNMTVDVVIDPKEVELINHLDSSLYFDTFNWHPQRSLEYSIHSIFRHKLNIEVTPPR